MVPLAWAARAAGHEVAVAVPPALGGLAAASGLPYAVVGRDVDAVAAFREIVSAPPGAGGGGPRVLKLIGALTEAMAEDLADLVGGWRADLVVHDPTAFAGPIAAAAAGVPAVRHLYGTDLLGAPAARNFLPAVLEPVAERLGLGEVDPFGVATVDPCPGSLQLPTASRRLPMRYVPSSPHGRTVPPLAPLGSRRRVAVTWGTTLDRLDPSLHLAGEVARAVAGPETSVVLAVTAEQAPLLGELPPWTRVVSDGALHQVLPGCDAVVAHGGAASILTAVAAGVPQLLLPRLPDHVRHSARLAEVGAGLVVPAAEAQGRPELVRERLAALLDEPGHAARARELAAESKLQPSPAEVVTELELLVTTEKAAGRPVGLKPGSAPR
ncbi:nucleotide disphospho-sugar-binding domain-containing protein [Streptacidiphilus anmyonensis]|uniref:nucleotide disphospho-sugar-binding domain-containing protein n=1 Tax=Streptacidiphilus anmyonensis TaxID=405782 RepID=UPI00191BD4DA|nr:nucleotide disphospho-sugar-binding domain-containing protein [Streptacidiphilus anmyonensis]